ncbi:MULTISPECIES: hypothetical protein [unclassified Streptomyces]|nr:hypothetical protein [Streptomyces sp. NBC_00523]WUC98207.1 hypothetical protein OHS17_00360 [Streptomyces sp. NBC_00523]
MSAGGDSQADDVVLLDHPVREDLSQEVALLAAFAQAVVDADHL